MVSIPTKIKATVENRYDHFELKRGFNDTHGHNCLWMRRRRGEGNKAEQRQHNLLDFFEAELVANGVPSESFEFLENEFFWQLFSSNKIKIQFPNILILRKIVKENLQFKVLTRKI